MQSDYAKFDRMFSDLRKSDDLGHQLVKKKIDMASKAASSSRTMDELDGDTAAHRRCFAPDAQSAGGARVSVARLQ